MKINELRIDKGHKMKKQTTLEEGVMVKPLVSKCNFWRVNLEDEITIQLMIKEDVEIALSNKWCELV
jgi:hypothetical protein